MFQQTNTNGFSDVYTYKDPGRLEELMSYGRYGLLDPHKMYIEIVLASNSNMLLYKTIVPVGFGNENTLVEDVYPSYLWVNISVIMRRDRPITRRK